MAFAKLPLPADAGVVEAPFASHARVGTNRAPCRRVADPAAMTTVTMMLAIVTTRPRAENIRRTALGPSLPFSALRGSREQQRRWLGRSALPPQSAF